MKKYNYDVEIIVHKGEDPILSKISLIALNQDQADEMIKDSIEIKRKKNNLFNIKIVT